MKFDQKYRNWLLKLSAQPTPPGEEKVLEDIWNNIEEELILDEAWNEIDAGLSGAASSGDIPYKTESFTLNPAIRILIIAITSVVVITLLLTLWTERLVDETALTANENTILQEENEPIVEQGISNSEIPSGKNPGQTTVQNSKISSGIAKDLQVIEKLQEREDERTVQSSQPKQNSTEKIQTIQLIKDDNSIKNIAPLILSKEKQSPVKEDGRESASKGVKSGSGGTGIFNEINFNMLTIGEIPASFLRAGSPDVYISGPSIAPASIKKWRIVAAGFSLSYNNSWILNDETLAGLESASLIDTRLSYAPEIGLSTIFASSKGYRIELEYYFLSNQNQRFFQYIDALYQEKKISLNYQKIHASWQFPVKILQGHLGLGSYFSVLTNANEIIGGKVSSVKDLYNYHDYGISMEFEKGIHLFSDFILTPSIRAQYSLNNIFKGNKIIPSYLRKTHNASLGINLGIYYFF